MAVTPGGTGVTSPGTLPEGYTRAVRALETGGTVLFGVLMAGLAVRLAPCLAGLEVWILPIALCALVGADFVSGMFHWAADTWGTPDTPLAGKVFVRPFREHHLDQLAITRHDFIEVNGNNCLISIPIAAAMHFIPFTAVRVDLSLLVALLGTFLLWIFATNQFHKWAHMERAPLVARHLQRLRLILPPEHHQLHHAAHHDTHYCITVGWLNGPLHRVGFFVALERLISSLTGLRPRRDSEVVVTRARR